MDLSLWDPPDDQGYPTPSYSNQSRYDTEDHWNYYFSLGYGRDMIEEDVLNEKSCVQVLRKLIDKADEEIIKLEEDIVMLQCQLAWVDEDWSKQCSGALGKEIGDLDILIQIRKEITDAHFNVQVEPRRLHDVVKPLLESYFLVKSKKRSYIVKEVVISKAKDTQHRFENEGKVANSYLESRETEIKISETVQPADVILASQLDHVKQLTEDSSKTRKSKAYTHAINKNPVSQNPSVGIIIRETNKVHERTEAMEAPATDKCDVEGMPVNSSQPMKDVHRLTLNDLRIIARKQKIRGYSNLRKKELQKLLRLEPQDSPFNPMVEMRKNRDTVKEVVISKAKDPQHRFEKEGKVANSYPESRETETKISETVQPADVILSSQSDRVKQLTEDSSKTRKSNAYTHAINKKLVSQKPSVGIIIRETKKLHERSEAMEASATDKCDMEGVPVNSLPPMKDVHSLTVDDLHIMARERKLRGYSKLRKEELQKLLGLEPQDSPFNPTVEMRNRRDTVKEVVISKAKDPPNESKVANSYPESRETEIKISETVQPADVILSSQSDHVKQLTGDSSKTRKSNAYTHAINKKLVSQKPSVGIIIRETKKLHERTEAMAAPATDKCDMEGVPVNSLPPMKDMHSLTVDDLHIMARERKLRGYSKLRKEELQKLLGLEAQDSAKRTREERNSALIFSKK